MQFFTKYLIRIRSLSISFFLLLSHSLFSLSLSLSFSLFFFFKSLANLSITRKFYKIAFAILALRAYLINMCMYVYMYVCACVSLYTLYQYIIFRQIIKILRRYIIVRSSLYRTIYATFKRKEA